MSSPQITRMFGFLALPGSLVDCFFFVEDFEAATQFSLGEHCNHIQTRPAARRCWHHAGLRKLADMHFTMSGARVHTFLPQLPPARPSTCERQHRNGAVVCAYFWSHEQPLEPH